MKKIIILFALVAMFAACKKEETVKPEQPVTPPTTEIYGSLRVYHGYSNVTKVELTSGSISYIKRQFTYTQSDIGGYVYYVLCEQIKPANYTYYIEYQGTGKVSRGTVSIEVGKTAIIKGL
jgi:hypothetical protein